MKTEPVTNELPKGVTSVAQPTYRQRIDHVLSFLYEHRDRIECFFSVDIQRENGRATPTVTIVNREDVSKQQDEKLREAMWEIANVLREIYAQEPPK